jgi:hypothetical protein
VFILIGCRDERRGRLETGKAEENFSSNKKEEFPGIMVKHAAWELLSPDLRCFCKSFCGKPPSAARLRKECGLK